MFKHAMATACFVILFFGHLVAADEKEPKYGWEYVKTLVEIRGQLHFFERDRGQGNHFVRVGGQFGLQMFLLDWSEAPELREIAKKLDGNYVLLTDTLKPPGKEFVILGYAGTVKVATFAKVSRPPRLKEQSKK